MQQQMEVPCQQYVSPSVPTFFGNLCSRTVHWTSIKCLPWKIMRQVQLSQYSFLLPKGTSYTQKAIISYMPQQLPPKCCTSRSVENFMMIIFMKPNTPFGIFEVLSRRLRKGENVNSVYILETDLLYLKASSSMSDYHLDEDDIYNFSTALRTTFFICLSISDHHILLF